MNTDQLFELLFFGNVTAVGTEEGGCLRTNDTIQGAYDLGHPESAERWWRMRINLHLEAGGEHSIGVYPVTNGHVRWGCVDWDEGDDDIEHALNVQAVLQHFEITSWIERSRSKGWHLWVLMRAMVPMDMMRKALLVACELAEAPAKEVNPKQMTLEEGRLGNYVRLPYPARGAWGNPDRKGARKVVKSVIQGHDCTYYDYDEFVTLAYQRANATLHLIKLAEMYVEPVASFAPTFIDEGSPDMIRRMGGLAHTIYMNGPLEGSDVSSTLFKLACEIKRDGEHTQEEAIALVSTADERWGKFAGRNDAAAQIARLVDKAWRQS